VTYQLVQHCAAIWAVDELLFLLQSGCLDWSEERQVLHSSDERDEILKWFCHNDCTTNLSRLNYPDLILLLLKHLVLLGQVGAGEDQAVPWDWESKPYRRAWASISRSAGHGTTPKAVGAAGAGVDFPTRRDGKNENRRWQQSCQVAGIFLWIYWIIFVEWFWFVIRFGRNFARLSHSWAGSVQSDSSS